jgi:phospholipase/lecithinase/hemolysin
MSARGPSLVGILAMIGLLLTGSGAAAAPAIQRVVVFGDSNVDDGNLYRLTRDRYPAPPRWRGRESDGPVVVEYLAKDLKATLEDHAVSGATTGDSNIIARIPMLGRLAATGMSAQIDAFLAQGGTLGETDLVVLWAGSNDIFGVKREDRAALESRIAAAVANLRTAVNRLYADGGRHFVVATRTPRQELGSDNDLNGVDLNHAILAMVDQLADEVRHTVILYDDYAAIADMVKNPSAYGFKETAALCVDVPACAVQNIDTDMSVADTYINWDAYHKTTHVHKLMAGQIRGLLSR